MNGDWYIRHWLACVAIFLVAASLAIWYVNDGKSTSRAIAPGMNHMLSPEFLAAEKSAALTGDSRAANRVALHMYVARQFGCAGAWLRAAKARGADIQDSAFEIVNPEGLVPETADCLSETRTN